MKKPLIEIEQLHAQFEGRSILKGVSFSVYPNQITVLLGPSGCGKTTVLKHLIGLYPVQKGRIQIMGQDAAQLDEHGWRRLSLQMGVLFQNGALLNSITVAENVAIPLELHTSLPREIIDRLVDLKLHLVGLAEAGSLYPFQLSGGMRKRAALARAIALDPPLLFCDEPSAGLDPITMEALDRLILDLKNKLGMTVVLVTHEVPSIFRLADRVVYMEDGTVLFEGSLEEALQSPIPVIQDFFRKGRGEKAPTTKAF